MHHLLLLHLLVLPLLLLLHAPLVPSEPTPSLPHQYFHIGYGGGATGSCWLTPLPFRPNDELRNLVCSLSTRISQLPDRITFQCEGDRETFCSECRRVRDEMEPAQRGKYVAQGCD